MTDMINKRLLVIILISTVAVISSTAQDKLYSNEFPLGDVTLLDGPFKHAVELNAEYLKKYTVDRLLFPFRKDAGLSTQGARNYVNWSGLDGHIGGHYLSALAMEYAATGDEECKKRMDYMVEELKKCQDANGNDANFVGYVGGVPGGKNIWRSYKSGNFSSYGGAWVPWYNVHKIYAGLRDAWAYGGNETAKTMFLALCDWGLSINAGLSDAQLQSMMGMGLKEQGSMDEMFADAYYMTNEEKYLTFAKKFSHTWLLDPMAAGNDMLTGNHANAQAAKVVGFQRIGEVGDDDHFHQAADFFWETVTTNRAIVIGGYSEDEWFRGDWKRFINQRNGVETCNTYNILKIAEGLFRQKPDAKYADYYERAMYNHILSTQHPDHGGYVYFTPTHPQHYRVYSAPDVAMWCCVGSGMENHCKYGQFIYTHQDDSLYVNLFIPSELAWKEKGVTVRQETEFPGEEQTILRVSADAPTEFTMKIRHPKWARRGAMAVFIGADTLGLDSDPSSYVEINRTWNDGDAVVVNFIMDFTVEKLHNSDSWYAVMRGPIALAARTSENKGEMPGLIAGDARMGHSPSGALYNPNSAPKLRINFETFQSEFIPVDGEPMTYTAPGIFEDSRNENLVFEPFYHLHDARYMLYWSADVSGTTGIKTPEHNASVPLIFRFSKNAWHFSFSSADPSRHLILYTLSGKKVFDISAPSRTMSINVPKHNARMRNGLYTLQMISEKNTLSKKVFIVE